MPTIKVIDSIKIDLYSREHPPPHFHVLYAEYEIILIIDDLTTYAGFMPKPQLNKAIDWAKGNKDMLLINFKRLNPRL